jgi:alpha-D-xyloside xylohydrolase
LASPWTKFAQGIRLLTPHGLLALLVQDAHTIRVVTSRDLSFFGHKSMVRVPWSGPATPFSAKEVRGRVVLQTSALKAWVNPDTAAVSFTDLRDRTILAEAGRWMAPATVGGEKTFHVCQTWAPNDDESLYGLGQRSMGPLDIKGIDLDLWQRNTFVVVPFLVSSRGYGIFWDNPSYTRFGDLRRPTDIPAAQLLDVDGKPGGLTGSFYAGRDFNRLVATGQDAKIDYPNDVSGSDGLGHPGLAPRPRPQGAGGRGRQNAALNPALPGGDVSARWEGFIDPPETGGYLFDTYSNGGIRLFVDGRLLINHWRQSWLPEKDVVRYPLVKGRRARIRLEWVKDQGANTFVFRWKTPSADPPSTSLWSEVGRGIDYTFVYGPSLDRVIQGYRATTGRATMPPKWAFGLWQSRQRYETQQQSLDVVDGYRKRGIPFDNIVQDWFYWRADQWGSHEFDPARFPDPVGWIKAIHERHANLMISVWGKFYPGTKNFDELRSHGYLYEPNLAEHRRDWVNQEFTFFDPFTPGAREMFWSQIDRELFKKGVDAWWMDASEPDLMSVPNLEGHRARMVPTGLGKPSNGINLYALATAQAVYEGQRRAAPDQRVFNLTRSGYAGQQRYGATTWSGDITSTWTALARQIPAGLGFSISGNPYWTMDTGGFSVPSRFAARNAKPEDVDEWRELNTRWFEFATFVPLLRLHGEFPYREIWQFGGEGSPAYRAMVDFDRLRYRLMPYLYSVAGAVTQDGATMMRPLAMDFPDDPTVRSLPDEYMFGPTFLVSPVVHYRQRVRPVVLPKGLWYDFWTGRVIEGGRTVEAAAPYNRIPLYVRAGSIVPFGPEIQYATEKPADPITLLVYTGADGQFSLYEDDGLTNAYERGEFARIPLTWSERTHTLTIGGRAGSFKGMLSSRTFRVAFVSPGNPVPFSFDLPAARTVVYSGAPVQVRL